MQHGLRSLLLFLMEWLCYHMAGRALDIRRVALLGTDDMGNRLFDFGCAIGAEMDNIIIERIWQDDGFFEIRVKAMSALVQASVDLYITESDVIALSDALSSFWPSNEDAEYYWEVPDPGNGKGLSFRVLPKDKLGHLLIEVYMLIKDGNPNHWNPEHHCCFYIQTELGLLNTFGKRLLSINKPGLGTKIALMECDAS